MPSPTQFRPLSLSSTLTSPCVLLAALLSLDERDGRDAERALWAKGATEWRVNELLMIGALWII